VTSVPPRIRAWDLPTRIFHWALAGLVLFSFTTGTIGGDWMPWHLRSGYTILTLVVFRIAWGVAGSETARFGHFLRGPRAVAEYARLTLAGRHPAGVGHNPLGGWVVVAMLAALAFQAATGLFSDDEIATRWPLAVKVSNAMVSRMSHLHDLGRWVVAGLAVIHVAAIAIYRWAWDVRLAGAMVTGWTAAPGGAPQPRIRSAALAAVLLAVAAAAVYALVEIYPMR
jgi:cytochrome b